jgi:hypothetical protein
MRGLLLLIVTVPSLEGLTGLAVAIMNPSTKQIADVKVRAFIAARVSEGEKRKRVPFYGNMASRKTSDVLSRVQCSHWTRRNHRTFSEEHWVTQYGT